MFVIDNFLSVKIRIQLNFYMRFARFIGYIRSATPLTPCVFVKFYLKMSKTEHNFYASLGILLP